MSVGVRTITRTFGNVAARSYTYTANALIHLMSVITSKRGLDQQYLQERHEVISAGLRTWLVSHHLEAVRIEVWDPKTDKAVEVYEFKISFIPIAGEAEESFETRAKKLDDKLDQLHELRPGMSWRILVSNKEGAPHVPGWTASSFRDISHLSRREAGEAISSAACKADLTFFIEGSSSCS